MSTSASSRSAPYAVGVPRVGTRNATPNIELTALYVLLSAVGVAMVFPFLWMIATSFKHPADIYSLSLMPSQPTLDNYVTALTKFPFARWFGNSVLVAVATTL